MSNYKFLIFYYSFIVLFSLSCKVKNINENKALYYLDLNPLTLEGLNQIPSANNGGKPFVKIDNTSNSEKNISIYYKDEPLEFHYKYDGQAWVTSSIRDIEGCTQYSYTYILNNKKFRLRYCGNPFSDTTFFLKSFMTISNDIMIDYLFKENVINKRPYDVINQGEILTRASYKDIFFRKLIKGNMIEEYSYRTNLTNGEKYGEKNRVFDLGELSINWFINCNSCFSPIEQ
jgi:hypothetical protein